MPEVIVAATSTARKVYHTDADCCNLPEDTPTRRVEQAAVAPIYRKCQSVSCGRDSQAETVADITCPECGEAMSTNAFRYHVDDCGGGTDD